MAKSSGPSLDSADYDPVHHLNEVFPTPASLSSLPTVAQSIDRYRNGLSRLIAAQVASRAKSNDQNIGRIQAAQTELTDLFQHVQSVQSQAKQTEGAISDVMTDIKLLDTTKQNLTLSMTVLKQLQMLATAYEQLKVAAKTRQYRDCIHPLEAVTMLAAHFKPYRSIDQVAALSRNISDLHRQLLETVRDDFELAFSSQDVLAYRNQLADGCLVIDALGDQHRARLVSWYCSSQLREYRHIFRPDQESGSLDNISHRYSWFGRVIRTFDTTHASIFPAEWKVDDVLIGAFSDHTREDYTGLLKQLSTRPNVELLLRCLEETLQFETELSRRKGGRPSADGPDTADEPEKAASGPTISSAFEPYLGLWVDVQDRQLSVIIAAYRTIPIFEPGQEFDPEGVLRTSTELFHNYRLCLNQAIRLSSGSRLLDVARLFGKYLDAYQKQVLAYHLHQQAERGEVAIPELVVILNTADYCHRTTAQLEERIRTRIRPDQAGFVNLRAQADGFGQVSNGTIFTFVRMADQRCQFAWREMRQTVWGRVDTVGDQSAFVAGLTSRIRESAAIVLNRLPNAQHGRIFCEGLADQVIATFVRNLCASRPISEMGAEQLLLDLYAIKASLVGLPKLITGMDDIVADFSGRQIGQSVDRLDSVLKTLQVQSRPADGLVQAYLIHIRDRSEANFASILELKGISRRQDRANLLSLFAKESASEAAASLSTRPQPFLAAFPLYGPGTTNPATGPGQGSAPAPVPALSIPTDGTRDASGSGAISSPLSHFLPSSPTFHPTISAVITAARESVDRFSSPSNLSAAGPDGSSAGGSDGAIWGGSGSRVVSGAAESSLSSSQPGLDLKAFGDKFKSTFRIGKSPSE